MAMPLEDRYAVSSRQHENPSGVKFCGECGARLELFCPSCRASNPRKQILQ